VVPVAAIVFVWQLLSLPSMTVEEKSASKNIFALLKRPVIAFGMAAMGLFFMGQFALFTYLRPFLETVTHVDVSTLSFLLLITGVTGVIGTLLIGTFLRGERMYPTLIVIPLMMAVIPVALIAFGGLITAAALLLGLWGLFATSAPVG
jgi:predicted MFS family arabinose efflux permease